MSYNTDNHFGIYGENLSEKYIKEFRNTCEYARYAFNEDGVPDQDCTWYDHEEDVKEFSKKHPEIIFELNGTGEESGDMWIKYFKNGKVQSCYAQITYEPYDENKLE